MSYSRLPPFFPSKFLKNYKRIYWWSTLRNPRNRTARVIINLRRPPSKKKKKSKFEYVMVATPEVRAKFTLALTYGNRFANAIACAAGRRIGRPGFYLSTLMQHRCSMDTVEKYTSMEFQTSHMKPPNNHRPVTSTEALKHMANMATSMSASASDTTK